MKFSEIHSACSLQVSEFSWRLVAAAFQPFIRLNEIVLTARSSCEFRTLVFSNVTFDNEFNRICQRARSNRKHFNSAAASLNVSKQ